MVAPAVHGALAPDSRTLPARGRGEAPREIGGLRRRERNWQDEVRDRVRKRKTKRGGEPELPLFESEASGSSVPETTREVEPSPTPVVPGAASDLAPVAERKEWAAPTREAQAPSFEGRILDRVDPLESLSDLPLQRPEVPEPAAAAPGAASDLLSEFEAPPEGSAEQLERGHRRRDGLALEFEAPPERSAEPPEDTNAGFESDGWGQDAPLEPRLELPPRLVEDRPVERPAQALERAQAAAVDVLLLGGIGSVVVYFASRFAHVSIEGLRPSWPYLGSYLAFLALVYAVYFTGTTGQTLGKIVYGLRVVDTAGRPPGYLRAAGRAALGAAGVVLVGLGLVPVLFDPARRAFHDRLLHTRVIRG
jgi:uncharacterized RDD family membrane protein YckC